MNTILFLLIVVGLHAVLWRLLRADDALRWAERFAAALTFQMAIWTGLSLLLGFLGGFTFLYLINWGLVILAGLAVASLYTPRVYNERLSWPGVRDYAASIHPAAWFFVLVGGANAVWFLWRGIYSPVLSADGLSYHLGTAVHMVQDGDFRHYAGESLYTNFFARGAEFLMAISIMAVGKTTLVNAVQWLVLPPAVASTYAMARALGAGRNAALGAATVPLAIPIVVLQSSLAYSDLLSNGWIVVALGALIGGAGASRITSARILWFFAAAGLTVAAKLNASVMVLLLGFGVIALWGPRTLFLSRRQLAATLAGFALAFAVGGSWMVRNWVQFGSPLYPFGVQIGPLELADGMFEMREAQYMGEMQHYDTPYLVKLSRAWTRIDLESWQRHGFPPNLNGLTKGELYDYSYGYGGDDMTRGFGATWPFLLLPGMLALGGLAFWKLPRDRRWYAVFLVAAPLAATYLQIAGWVPRFSLFLPFAGAVALAVVVQTLHGRMKLAAELIVAVLAVTVVFDAMTTIAFDRHRERVRRYFEANPRGSDAPIDFYYWLNPQLPDMEAIHFLMHEAKSGDTVSFWTPRDPLYTGYFVDEQAEIRLFLFPSVFPDPFYYSTWEMMDLIEKENIQYLLLAKTLPPNLEEKEKSLTEFTEMIEKDGGEKLMENQKYAVYELSE